MKAKKVITRISLILLSLMVFINIISSYLTINPNVTSIYKVSVTEEYIIISGFNNGGGIYNYRNYKTSYENGTLYIKFLGGFRMPWMEETNSPDFYPIINHYEYEDMSQIYLSSAFKKDARLVWTKENSY